MASNTKSEYDRKREENIARNKAMLQGLDIPTNFIQKQRAKTAPRKANRIQKPSLPSLPARASARLAARPEQPQYNVPKDLYKEVPAEKRNVRGRASRRHVADNGLPETDETDEDEEFSKEFHGDMITGWVAWEPEQPEPTRDENGTFSFDSHPQFLPNKAPWEVMREGSFGGTYWRDYHSFRLGVTISDDWRELPTTWLHGINPAKQLTRNEYDPLVNKYGVKSGQTLEEWERNGWINHHFDVRGWFQWYCRFFQGRRCDDDERQIQRWANCVGENGRWRRILLKKYVQAGIRSVTDEEEDEIEGVSPVVHQTLHHWAFEIRQNVLDDYWRQVGG